MQNNAENLSQILGELLDLLNPQTRAARCGGKAKGQAGSKAGEQAEQYQHAS